MSKLIYQEPNGCARMIADDSEAVLDEEDDDEDQC